METTSNVCNPDGGLLGHFDQYVIFNFSKAENNALNEFLKQQFTTVSGAIVMEGNDRVTQIHFADITAWVGSTIPGS